MLRLFLPAGIRILNSGFLSLIPAELAYYAIIL